MPYVSPKMVESDKVVIGLSDVLASTSLGGEVAKSKSKPKSTSPEIPTPVTAPSLGECGADSSSSVDTLSSTNTAHSSTSPADSPPLVTPDDTDSERAPTPIEAYSRSVYAFTMNLYNEARVQNLRRTAGKKSYSCKLKSIGGS